MQTNKPTLLIVDDVVTNIQLLAGFLEQDYRIQVATNGAKALEIATSATQPDLILLDVMMPVMDGYSVCKKLKEDPKKAQIPVIFVTAKGELQDQIFGFNLGAVDYVVKPFESAIVKARVKTHIALKQKTEALERLTLIDGLTGVANRRRFDEVLNAQVIKAQQLGESIALIMIDIDHFKAYNDGYGHGAGDDCLVAVAQGLQRSLNEVAQDRYSICRYGGEEFAAVMPNIDANEVYRIAEKLKDDIFALKIAHAYSPVADHITLSIGCSVFMPKDMSNAQKLLKMADEMLYVAKDSGRNRVSCISGDVQSVV
jgi:diguanylate cyclase (GGDEF)-like protein